MVAMPEPVLRRHRSKSAPRGRSPDPKSLKKAAKEARRAGLVTPPPRPVKEKSSSDVKSRGRVTPHRISFGENTEHPIVAENRPPTKEMNIKQADAILQQLKDCPSNPINMYTWSLFLYHLTPNCFLSSSRTKERNNHRPNGSCTAYIGNSLKYQASSRKLQAFQSMLFENLVALLRLIWMQ